MRRAVVFAPGSDANEHESACRQAGCDNYDDFHVGVQKGECARAVFDTERRQREIANGACGQHNHEKRTPSHVERAGAKNRDFQWQRQRRNRRKKNGDEPVVDKPGMQPPPGSFRDMSRQENLTAFTGNAKQEGTAEKRAGDGAQSCVPGLRWMPGGISHQQKIDAGDDGNAS
jgi:hypothetical protein